MVPALTLHWTCYLHRGFVGFVAKTAMAAVYLHCLYLDCLLHVRGSLDARLFPAGRSGS